MEIALKVANKIRARERFAVYIVVPMWPEGVPTSTPTQRILFWQVDSWTLCFLRYLTNMNDLSNGKNCISN